MKKFLTLVVALVFICNMQLLPSAFCISVPENLVEKQATLLLYLLDAKGNQSIGKCHLDKNSISRVILQSELEMASCDDEALLESSVDLLSQADVHEQAVIVSFELDQEVKVIRILVVKDCLLDQDPFDVVLCDVSLDAMQFEEFYQESAFDELSSLTEQINNQSPEDLINFNMQSTHSLFDQYLAYVKIFALLQYGKVQRAMRSVSSWWTVDAAK